MPKWKNSNAVLMSMVAAFALAGCNALVSEEVQSIAGSPSSSTCRYSEGEYALPKDILVVDIFRDEGIPNQYTSEIKLKRTASDQHYCLDFLGSALASDRLEISRSSADPRLLGSITSEFQGKTLDVGEAFINAAAQRSAAAGRSAFANEQKQILAGHFEFDPFDRGSITRIDGKLRDLDHCIFIDPTDDPYVPAWQSSLCSSASPTVVQSGYYGLSVIKASSSLSKESPRGVLYRPMLTHKLVVMRRDHAAGGAWKLFETRRVHMPNAAPAFSLEVKRSLFVDRKMDIAFDGGVLSSIKIDKPSEAEAFSGFVLRTMQVIVSIPVRALIIGKTDTENRNELIQAQGKLIATLREYDEAVKQHKAEQAAISGIQSEPQRAAFVNSDPLGSALESGNFADCINSAAGMESAYQKCQKIVEENGNLE
ncbi:hypothetical protein PMI07_006323 [Rhizobium sp. CF080]|uniref:hypothetical protein n=1 Tax=Rhizobium sp. (strain CF080) TaxID=1144310 RepID=UPI000271810E|nr:hypothetical protein [Rhizobium sp. CF080]EUC00043.1 hypothetical protein PMI07_006323 [Rhizobium sp. CF080]